ncbi:hypothetical protein BD626DRAFT_85719 [Schizophyllum amplum]|uniref:F-box domain-containing protein n=1 Tax=Schizophyllum amplum TaxID=97359 RepID=A0A550C9B0_9AGAR|nr:hypothetical protein BD626DRAFT_85719 [Auriculariopsis ampla]
MRRSSRISASSGHKLRATDDESFDSDAESPPPSDNESDYESGGPARKRTKTKAKPKATTADACITARPRTRVRGQLAALQEMPLDILFLIFSYMHPLDLLHTARTTKTLRSILMSRSSAWIWRDSYAAACDVPPAPEDDVTIPEFVSLLYDRICSYCDAPSVKTVIWAARIRCCKKCISNNDIFMDCEAIDRFGSLWRVAYRLYLPHIVVQVRRYRTTELYPSEFAEPFVEEFITLDRQTKGQWLAAKAREFAELTAHASLCEKWDKDRQVDRKEELQKVRNDRRMGIIRRLTDLGWGDELEKGDKQAFAKQKLVRKAQPLSDKVWLHIKDEMVEFMEQMKAARLSQALRARYELLSKTYRTFCRDKPLRTVFPGVGDIITIAEVAIMIEDTPYDVKLTEADLRAVLDAIPESYFANWRAVCDTALVKLLNSARRKDYATEADLDLASTVFGIEGRNRRYDKDLPYPLVLVSEELTRVSPNGSSVAEPNVGLGQQAWSADRLIVSTRDIAKLLVELARLDPRRATCEDMDDVDPWYACFGDQDSHPTTWATDWRCARRQGGHNLYFKLLGPEQTWRAREMFQLRMRKGFPIHAACAYCDDALFTQSSELYQHLLDEHAIDYVMRRDYVCSVIYDDSTRARFPLSDIKPDEPLAESSVAQETYVDAEASDSDDGMTDPDLTDSDEEE